MKAAVAAKRLDNTGCYKKIMYALMPAVVTVSGLKNALGNDERWSTFVRPSDEAFVIVVLLNNWNVWTESNPELQIKGDKIYDDSVHPVTKKHLPLWSRKYVGSTQKKLCGWDEVALVKYQELVSVVEEDRRRDDNVSKEFDDTMRNMLEETLLEHQLKAFNKNKVNSGETGNRTASIAEASTIVSTEMD